LDIGLYNPPVVPPTVPLARLRGAMFAPEDLPLC
jgi:hypothetical protein